MLLEGKHMANVDETLSYTPTSRHLEQSASVRKADFSSSWFESNLEGCLTGSLKASNP